MLERSEASKRREYRSLKDDTGHEAFFGASGGLNLQAFLKGGCEIIFKSGYLNSPLMRETNADVDICENITLAVFPSSSS